MAAPLCIYEEVIPDINPYNRFIYAYTNEKMLYVQTKLQSRKNPPRLLSGFGEKHECRNTKVKHVFSVVLWIQCGLYLKYSLLNRGLLTSY